MVHGTDLVAQSVGGGYHLRHQARRFIEDAVDHVAFNVLVRLEPGEVLDSHYVVENKTDIAAGVAGSRS